MMPIHIRHLTKPWILNQQHTNDEDVLIQYIPNISRHDGGAYDDNSYDDGGDDNSYSDGGDCKEINGRTNCKIIH